MTRRGKFISLEGGEGVGKSTQVKALAEALRGRGLDVLVTREPGGSDGAEKIRELLLSGSDDRWGPQAEALLFAAARADHVAKTIRPALDRGQWVLADRFIDSSLAYQGGAGGLGIEAVRAINALGRPVALLSNGDEAMLRAFADTFDARFDHVFASDHAGKYKPHPAIYALPSRALGLQPNDILHVAGSGNDVIGCKHAGLACACTNRSGDVLIDPDVHPEHELRTLAELIDFI